MNINVFGQMNVTGVGRHIENFFFAMVRRRQPGTIVNYLDPAQEGPVRNAMFRLQPQDATIFLWKPRPEIVPGLRGRKIVWPYFESDRLPPKWVAEFALYDEVWSPTHWGRQVLIDNGLPQAKVRVVEAGVNDKVFFPRRRAHDGFVFLSVGKYENRKSIDEMVAAFEAEFPRERDPDVRLRLKADFPLFPDRVQQLRARVAGDSRIEVVSGEMRDDQIADLYNEADAFLFPSKAEGFGLPCIEALACGVPVIATCCSGQSTFLDRLDGLYCPVQFTRAPLVDADYARFYAADYAGQPYGTWAIPSMASLRESMRSVQLDPAGWRERAARAAQIVQREFSWDEVARKANSVLMPAA